MGTSFKRNWYVGFSLDLTSSQLWKNFTLHKLLLAHAYFHVLLFFPNCTSPPQASNKLASKVKIFKSLPEEKGQK